MENSESRVSKRNEGEFYINRKILESFPSLHFSKIIKEEKLATTKCEIIWIV